MWTGNFFLFCLKMLEPLEVNILCSILEFSDFVDRHLICFFFFFFHSPQVVRLCKQEIYYIFPPFCFCCNCLVFVNCAPEAQPWHKCVYNIFIFLPTVPQKRSLGTSAFIVFLFFCQQRPRSAALAQLFS